MSTNKSWPTYKKLKAKYYNITKFILPPDSHYKYVTAKENFEQFLRELRVHLVKDTTTLSSKVPKLHVKLVTHMHYENEFFLIIAVIFVMIPQLGGPGPKY